jgi:hypothetical protein
VPVVQRAAQLSAEHAREQLKRVPAHPAQHRPSGAPAYVRVREALREEGRPRPVS